jgi:rare lipoprotein A
MRRVLTQSILVAVFVSTLGAEPSLHNFTVKPLAQKLIKAKPQAKPYQVGKASWYGKLFHGKTTASGEPYDMFKVTAAHPKLPLGSFVRVTNLANRRSVVVRINDRGPIAPGRVIDVSYKTARILGFHRKGIQRVRLDVVNQQATVLAAETSPNFLKTLSEYYLTKPYGYLRFQILDAMAEFKQSLIPEQVKAGYDSPPGARAEPAASPSLRRSVRYG